MYAVSLSAAEAADYRPFVAMLKGRLGTLLSHADAESAKRLRNEAAQTYEQQGDLENGLHFHKLIIARYRAAAEHYRRVGDEERYAAVLAKAQSSDPEA